MALTELEFRSGVTAQTISVATTADGLDEADGETFTVTLSGPGNAELATGAKTATGTINDNDGEPEVSITGAPVVVEGTAASFVVELSAESRKTVTVSYATADGTALKSEDYTAVALTELEFRSGVTAQTISVATTVDGLDEADGETFTVTLSGPGNAELATGAKTATGTINDNDGEPEVSITGAPVVVEGTAASFVVELSAESRKTVTVSYETADGTALASEDYTKVAATTLEFRSGVTAQTISVATTVDGLDEADGETFTVTLSAPVNAELATGAKTATGTIDDNDGEPEVSITGAPVVTEGTAASFVVELSGESRKTVTVSYATADGTALKSEDYTAVALTELEFRSGVTAQTISVATTADGLDEADGETFTVTLSAPVNAELATGAKTATGTIDDNDDEPEVSITGAPVVVEGTAASFVVELSGESRKTVTVSYKTADGTALASEDYTAVALTELEFTSGVTAKTISVATTADGFDEADGETFTVTLSAPGNAALATDATTATGTIDDNDDEPKVSITGAPVVVEGTAASFVVELSAESRKTVTVSYKTADGTALASEDYTAVALTELEFRSGVTAQTISVATTVDGFDEADGETFTVTLSAPGNAALATDATTATGTINDNDDPPEVSITGTPVVVEGTAASFVVELSVESRKTVTVSYETADGTALESEDYTAVALTELEFRSGVTAQTISVATTVDGFDEADGETFTVTLSDPDNAELATGAKTTTGTINDNDDPPGVSIKGTPVVTEGTAASFVVELSGESRKTVTVSYETADGTALADEDYPEVDATEVEFTSGVTAQTISVATSEDTLNESNESFKVTLSSASNATLDTDDAEATGTIEDDDELTAAVTADSETGTVAEGDSTAFTVKLTGGTSTAEVVVGYSLVGSATELDDYEAPSGKLTIGSPLTSGQIAIKTLEDDVLDWGETLEVRLDSATSAGTVNVSDATAETRIVDSSEVTVSVKAAVFVEDDPDTPEDESQDTSVVAEGGTASFVVELSGTVSVAVAVPYETADGSALAGADKDYTENSGTLNFAPTETSKTVEVVTRDDGLSEVDETFEVRLTATSLPDGVSVAKASATGTITDNDTLTAAVTADNPTVTEDQSATFTVTLTEATSTAEVVVDYSLVGTATEGDDYTAPSGKLTIGASDASGEIAIKTLEDDVLDRGETLEVRLDKARTDGTATVSTATAETTITDPGTVQVSVTGLTVNEGDPPVTVDKSSVEEGEPASFVVQLSSAVQKTVEVSYATSDGTGDAAATAGTDYTAATVTLAFSSKETSKTVAVTTTEDTDNEADETFTVTLTGVTLPDGVSLDASATTATGTIENDDALTATVKANAENVTEGNAAGFTVELTGGTSTADVEVTYTWASTGTAGTDYTAPNGLLTIATPDSSGTISIATLTDDVLDPGETLSVTLTDATTATGTATVGTPATATTTIAQEGTVTVSVRKDEVLDDDTTQDVDEYEDKSIVEEGGSASFIVELSGAVASAVEVSYATSDGTAEAGTNQAGDDKDYRPASGTLIFKSGESLTQTIAVTTTNDTLNEPTEKFTVTLTGPDLPDQVSIGTSSAQGTITDNDDLTVAVTAVETSVDEGETAEFAVALTGGTSTAEVLVTYTVGGTATAGDDYTAPDLTLTIGTGVASGTIAIETLIDRVLEDNDETVEVTLTGATTSTGTATVDANNATASTAINNTTTATVIVKPPPGAARTAIASRSASAQHDERAAKRSTRLMIAASCYTCADEGESVDIYLGLGHPDGGTVELESGETVSVAYQTAGGSADASDYAATSGTLVFAPNESGDAVADPIRLQTTEDTLNEADEQFALTFMAATLPDGKTTSPGSVPVTIEDDDPLTVEVTRDSASVEEGNSATFTVSVTGSNEMTAPVVINYTASGPVSTGASGNLTIAVGDSTGTITIGTRDDSVIGPNAPIRVTLSASSAGEVNVVGSPASTSVADDDKPTVQVSPDAAEVTEGDQATFTVTLSVGSPADVRVGYSVSGVRTVADDSATVDKATADQDFTTPHSMLTISAGASSGKITVDTLTDKLLERDETFEVKLDPARSTSTVTVDRTPAITTIKEAASVTLTLDPDSISEDGGVALVTATVSQDSEMFEVRVSAEAVAPGVAGDFALTANSVLHFAADATTSTGTVTITAVDNDVDAADKTVTVTGTVAVRGDTLPGLPVSPATLTITDDDERGVTVDPDKLELAPGDPTTPYSVRLNSEPTDAVTVQLTPSDDDYVAVSPRALTFTPNDWETPQEVEVTAHSNAPANDTVTISHVASGGDYGGESASVTITIFDPPSVTIADADAVEKQEEAAFEVSLSATSSRQVTVNYKTYNGTAKAGEDFGEDYRAAEGTRPSRRGRPAPRSGFRW